MRVRTAIVALCAVVLTAPALAQPKKPPPRRLLRRRPRKPRKIPTPISPLARSSAATI